MAGFRIAEGYIEVTVDDSRVAPGIQQALQSARSSTSRDAQRLGQHIGQQINQGINDGTRDGASQAGQQGGQTFSRGFTASAGAALKGGVAGLAAAAGAVFVKGFGQALEQGNVTARLQAQLGATPKEAKKYGDVAGQLYTHGITDTFEEGAAAIKAVMQQGLVPAGATNAQIQSIAGKVTDLSKTFDMDLGGATNAVSQMMKTGLAKNAQEALDIMTRGAQTGADKAGDLADTFNEYGTQFRKVGLDGKTAMGLLSQGLQAGARDADIVADSIKEFSIRAVDGSKTTVAGFQALGLNADDMASRIAKGGKSASQGLDLTLDRLRGIKDPAERSRIAVQLFGTQAEDMGDALYALDPSKAVKTLGDVGGAAEKMGKTLHSGPSHQITVFKRTLEQGVVNFIGGTVLPALMSFGSWLKNTFGPFFTTAKTAVAGFFNQIGGKDTAINGAKSALSGLGSTVRDAVNPVFQAAVRIWRNDLQPAVAKLAATFRSDMMPALNKMWGIVKNDVLPAFLALWSGLQQALLPIMGKIASIMIGTVYPAIMKIYRSIADTLKPIFAALAKTICEDIAPRLKEFGGKLSELVGKMQPVISVVSTVITWLVKLAGKILATVIPPLIRLTGKVLVGLIDIIIKVIGKITDVIGWFVKFGTGVVNAVKKIKSGFDDMWSKVKSVFSSVTKKVSEVKSWLSAKFTDIKNAITARWSDAWNAITKKVVDFFVWHAKKITDSWAWLRKKFTDVKNAITKTWSDAWSAIRSKLTDMWSLISKKVTEAFAWLRKKFTDLKHAITKTWSDAWGAIRTKLSDAWSAISKKVTDSFSSLRGKFTDVKNSITKTWSDAWSAIRTKTTDLVSKVLSKVTEFKDKVKTAFTAAKDGIKETWEKVQGVVKKPINYVIDPIYKTGIKGLWDKVAGFVGMDKLPSVKKLAAGGTVGTEPGVFNAPTAIVGEGNPNYPEYVIPTDPKHRKRALGLYERAGTQLMDEGGILGKVGGAIKGGIGKVTGAASAVGGWMKDKAGDLAAGALEPFFKAGMKIVTGLLDKIPGASTGFGKMMKAVPQKYGKGILSWLKGKDEESSGGGDVAAALKWARTQAGKPYQWGGAGNPSWDCCLVGTVRIYGPNGATPIQDVRAGDEVYAYVDGRLTPQTVTAAWQSETQRVLKVRTRNRNVVASANHPFMRIVQVEPSRPVTGGSRGERTLAKFDVEWARLDELQRGDLLVQPRAMDTVSVEQPTLPDGTDVTEDVAWLLGLFVGDGYLTNNTIRICVYNDNSVRAQRIFRSLGVNSFTSKKHGVVASSVSLVQTLEAMGLRLPGPNKRVPSAVWAWNEALQQAFLDGYCAADGHRPADPAKHGDRTYASASRELLEDVRAMHMMLGQPVSNITTNYRTKPITIKGVEVKNARPLHSFTVWPGVGRGEVVFRRNPGLAAWLDASDFTVAKVLEVTEEGIQDTYDLEVAGAHNFVADGVVVHNSGFMGGIQKKIDGKNPNGRIWSTFSFSGARAPSGWVRHLKSPFQVGITNRGKGHTAGTLGGVNVESRGGDGVLVGPRARGYNSSLFTDWYGYKPAKSSGGDWSAKGTGVARWRPHVIKELKHLGLSTGWQDTVLRRMNQESGGDPNVVNKWDSNWHAGHPSVGLMQVIRGTFDAYAGSHRNTGPKKYGVSVQPNANIHAGLNYANKRYGSLAGLNRPGGYDAGGWLPPGSTLAVNKTGKPEAILTNEQWSAIERFANTGDPMEVHVHFNSTFPPTREQAKQAAKWLVDDMREEIRKKERAHR
ncbi:phage tail tape measure protein [Streptomyces ortus]|uniref:Phage tail tape measure protein n=1 Tax=Streptomyces ortus TaxID=2867268 RepID=A0ABT3UZL3_9ACTN|nr:phage tail tape measure protein [Streptomyces ortus]MCX4232802.1 phage tail tape measure protein [Streptomyces ortus]